MDKTKLLSIIIFITSVTKGNLMKKILLITSAITISSLVACGGGGGGGGGSTPSTVNLSGVAAKGLLSGADVQAYEVVDGALKALGSPQKTKDDGSYELTGLPSTTNPVVVKLTTNATTEMLDETKPLVNNKFDKGTQPKVGTEIRSMLPSLSATSEVHITPFTEMAVSAAESTGKITAESMASAQTIIADSLGVDPFKTKPVNADATSLSADQTKLMFLLTAVAIDAQTSCTGDTSGVSCALKRLNDSAKIEKDSNGDYKVKSAGSITTKLANLKTSVGSYSGTSTFLTAAKSTASSYTVPTEPTSVNPVVAVKANSLDAFLSSLRIGFKSAQDVMEKRSKAAGDRIDQLVFESAASGVNILKTVVNNCDGSSQVFVCTDSADSTGVKFTSISSGSYKFTYSSIDSVYSYNGNISGSISSGNLSVKINNTRKKGSTTVESIELVASGSGLTEGSKSATVSLDTFIAKMFDKTDSSKYKMINLSGLTLAGNKDTKKINLSTKQKFTIATSEGDGLVGSINNLELTDVTNTNTQKSDAFPNKLDAALTLTSKEGDIFGIALVGQRDVQNFNPWFDKSASNVPNETVNMMFTLADNNTISLTHTQTKYNESSISVVAKTGQSSITLSGVANIDSNGHESINSDGITITSSGVFNAKIAKDSNGNYQGKLYQGKDEIGVIENGIIKVVSGSAYKEVSLK